METEEKKEKPLPRYKQLKLEIEQRKKEKKRKERQRKDTIYRRKLRARKKKEKKLATKRAIIDERKRLVKENSRSWRIVLTSQKKRLTDVKYFNNKEAAVKAFNKIIEENKKEVRFPKKYTSRDHIMVDADYELLLMRKRKDYEPDHSLLRNEIGIFAPNKTNSGEWLIHDKSIFLYEEEFWVYGYNPKLERKDFNFILHEILLYNLPNVKYHVKRVMVFRNKLIIEDEEDFDMIICKNENDCVRLYNELEKEIIKMKYKSVFFSGFVSETMTKKLIAKIGEKTGWNLKKINRYNTRP